MNTFFYSYSNRKDEGMNDDGCSLDGDGDHWSVSSSLHVSCKTSQPYKEEKMEVKKVLQIYRLC